MATGKKSILFYVDWKDIFLALKDNEAGKLVKHLCRYISDENPEDPSGLVGMGWIPMKSTLKRDLKKWEQFIEKQSINGSKGGRPETQKTQAFSKKPKKAVIVTDTVSVTDKVNDKEVYYRAFVHLKISEGEISKLLDAGYTMQQIDDTLDAIQNYKRNKNYTSLYLTAKKWLKKDAEDTVKTKTSKLDGAKEAGERADQSILNQIKESM